MKEQEIIQFLQKKKKELKNGFGQWIKSKKNKVFLDFIMEKTQFLDPSKKYSFGQRLWHIFNNVYEAQKCKNKECQHDLLDPKQFLGLEAGYRKYCCVKCAANDEQVREHYKETCLKKYKSDNVFSSEYGIKKIQETSIKNHGVPYYNNVEKARETRAKKNNGKWHPENFGDIVKEIKEQRYGNPNYNNLEQIKKTCLEEYGVEFAFLQKYSVEASSEKLIRRSYDLFILNNQNDEPLFSFEEYFENHRKNVEFKFKCKKCGYVFLSKHKNGRHRLCPKCFPKDSGNSFLEINVEKFICSLLNPLEVKINDRETIYPLELDINIPNKKIAFEIDGLYWHSEAQQKNNVYHLIKTNLCNNIGIQLVHIFEDELIYHNDIVKSRIKNLLGIYDVIIFARKCEVKEVGQNTSNAFQKQNHIQGSVNSSVNLGLFHGNELISLMTFSKSRFNKKYEWELIRFCNKLGYHIPGAASKLLKHFERNYCPKSLISYADRRWSQGKMYEAIGFKLDHISKPNYWYVTENLTRSSRIQFQKHKLKDLLEKFDPNKTEVENMKDNGYYRIFDCGNLVYVKEYKNESM